MRSLAVIIKTIMFVVIIAPVSLAQAPEDLIKAATTRPWPGGDLSVIYAVYVARPA